MENVLKVVENVLNVLEKHLAFTFFICCIIIFF